MAVAALSPAPCAAASGDVSIAAFDHDGNAYGPVSRALGANQAVRFNSRDLEYGNPGKGLTGATGPGRGDWRLELESDLGIEVLAYLRTREGLVTAMHDTARWSDGGLFVPVFGPGSSRNRESPLRLVNIGDAPAAVTIAGTDAGPGVGAVHPRRQPQRRPLHVLPGAGRWPAPRRALLRRLRGGDRHRRASASAARRARASG